MSYEHEDVSNRKPKLPARWRSDQSVRFVVGRPGSSHTKRLQKIVFTASLLGAQHKKRIVWRTSWQACLWCPWARQLTGRFHLYVADRWPTRTSPSYNCEVANPACRKRRLLGINNRSPPCWWWGYQSLMTGSKWAAIFPLA